MIYGYVRVSTKEQNESRQVVALAETGIDETRIFVDKESGKNFERTNYQRMLKKLKKGDCIVVKSLDRFGRNYKEVQDEWQKITKKGIDIKILDMPILDTTNHKDLIGTLISDIVLQLLAYVAQTEREHIRQRQAEGIAIAKAKGIRFGRPNVYNYETYNDIFEKLHKHEITNKQAMEQIGCHENTYYKLLRQYREANGIAKEVKERPTSKAGTKDYNREYFFIRYHKRKEIHRCVRCNTQLPEDDKRIFCESCREKNSIYEKRKLFRKNE